MFQLLWNLPIWKRTDGQDLIEYALMVGVVALASAAFIPEVTGSISTIFGRITQMLNDMAAQSGS